MKMNKVNHSYQSYNCADGVANVNIYNGNLLFEYPLVSTGMNSFEISTSLVYNSDYNSTDFNGRIIGMGNGWKLNIEQYVFKYESGFNLEGFSEDDYVYIDSNWNIHKFVKYYPNDDTTYPMYYYDEGGTGLRLTIKNNDYPYEIKDNNGNVLVFNLRGLIVKITSSINDDIEKQIVYNNQEKITSIFDIRKSHRKIKFLYNGNCLIDCYVCEEIENNGQIRILNKGKKSYKFEYDNNKLKEIIKYTTVEEDGNELHKKMINFEYIQDNENKMHKIINSTNLTGLLLTYNDDKKISVVTQTSFTINYCLEHNELEKYLGEENFLTNIVINEDGYVLGDYLHSNSSKVNKYEYLTCNENILSENKYYYEINKTSLIDNNNIKFNYYFSDDENLICTLEEKNNTLYTLFDNHGWYIYPSNHNNKISSTINRSTGYVLNSNNNFTLNIDSLNFTNFNLDTENDAEYLNISFFVSNSNGEINDFVEYNYSGIKANGTKSIFSSNRVRLEKTKESIWQYVTLPIKILKQYGKIGDVEIKFSKLDNNANVKISNLQVNRGLYNQLYIYKNGTSYIESNINHCTEIEIDGVRQNISKDLYITESDLAATYKNLFLKQEHNETRFDFVYNGGKKVKKVSNIKLIADDNEYEFNIINFSPNYYTKTVYVTDNKDEANGKKYTWLIYENQMTYKYDSNTFKYYYELKTICGTTYNIVETTHRLDEDQSDVLYNQVYFDGNHKGTKKYDNLITECIYDEYGNIEKRLVYNESDLSNSMEILYCYEDGLDISDREIPKTIQENNITTFFDYDVLNQKIESIKIGNQLAKYEYDIFKENCINIKFENESTNEEIENNRMIYNANSDIKSIFSNDTKYEFFYNKLGELLSIKNDNIGCLEFNYENTTTENIYTTNRIKYENNQKELIYSEKLKCDKYGKIKELYINDATYPIVTYEYENEDINPSDFLTRVIKIEDGFSNKNHEFSYIDNAQSPYSIETINNNDYIKRSSNSLEYKLNTDEKKYLYNVKTIPVMNYTYKTSCSEKQNDTEKEIESFNFLYENDNLNRPNRKVRMYKLCSNCNSSSCNCGQNANIIDNIVVDRQISYCDNTMLPEQITYNVDTKYEGANYYFYYKNTYINGNVSQVNNYGIYFTRNPYNYSHSLDFVLNDNVFEYEYDELNRIKKEKYSISLDYRNKDIENVNYNYECTYEYDDNSNMLCRKKTANKDIKFISSNGRLTKIDNNDIITYVNYDDFGNMLNDHNHTYEYNYRGLLSKCSYKKDDSTSYISYYNYDYRGNRYQKESYINSYKLYTINYYYDNDTLLGEDWVDENNDVRYKFRYFYDLEGITGFNYWSSSDSGYNNNGYNYNYIKDSLGNINKIMYEGETIGEYVYDAWGNSNFIEYVSINDDLSKRERDFFVLNYNPFRYKGYYYDVETNLFLVSSRYYSPELCRWISPDDIEYLDPESVNGLNLYCYCMNNPIMYVDPTGHFAISTLVWILIGTAVLVTAGTITYGAVTDTPVVLDLSASFNSGAGVGYKVGISVVFDFKNDNIEFYGHHGITYGVKANTFGISYSPGVILNYENPGDYGGPFKNYGGGWLWGIDHCYDPRTNHSDAVQAYSITFGNNKGVYFGDDKYYYWGKTGVPKWMR